MSVSLIIPEATTNQVLNPSAEIAGNFAAVGGAATRVTTYSTYDAYSYRVQTTGDNEGITLTLNALANAIHYVTVRVRGTLPAAWDWSLNNAAYTAPILLSSAGDWDLYGLEFSAAQANGSTTLRVYQNGAGAGDFYIDGVQVEEKAYWTTYCGGEQDGCEWNGAAHAATSTRSAQSRAGGLVVDLADYNISVDTLDGLGMPPVRHNVRDMALQPGRLMDNIKVLPRVITLICHTDTTTHSALYAARRNLINAIKADRVAPLQPFILRYEDGNVKVEAECYYDAGFEGSFQCSYEAFALRLIAYDPYWYEIGESAWHLDSVDTANFTIVAARLRSTGQWDNLGDPGVTGAGHIWAFAEDSTYIYVGGDFLNFDGGAGNGDNIVRYNKQTGAWSPLGTGMNGAVSGLAISADGTLYAVGSFTTAGGNAANRIAAWNGAVWAAVGAPGLDGITRAITIGLDGMIYVCGDFANAGGAGAVRIASWDGAAWAALGTGLNNSGRDLDVGPDGTLYVGGDFATAGGVTVACVAKWDGAWSAMGSGTNNPVQAVVVGSDGTVYIGGAFTTAGGNTANRVAAWNGAAWSGLGNGFTSNDVYDLAIGPDNFLYACGRFVASTAGVMFLDSLAKWNGSVWVRVDADLPGVIGTNYIYRVFASQFTDPVIRNNYDIWTGFSSSAAGAGYFAGSETVVNSGTATIYPIIVFMRAGGTSATLISIRNETTGQELLFDYDLLDGEELTIDLMPGVKSITSNFFGNVLGKLMPNSDFATFSLIPGNNVIACFISEVGNPTITAYMVWRDAYWGAGGMEP